MNPTSLIACVSYFLCNFYEYPFDNISLNFITDKTMDQHVNVLTAQQLPAPLADPTHIHYNMYKLYNFNDTMYNNVKVAINGSALKNLISDDTEIKKTLNKFNFIILHENLLCYGIGYKRWFAYEHAKNNGYAFLFQIDGTTMPTSSVNICNKCTLACIITDACESDEDSAFDGSDKLFKYGSQKGTTTDSNILTRNKLNEYNLTNNDLMEYYVRHESKEILPVAAKRQKNSLLQYHVFLVHSFLSIYIQYAANYLSKNYLVEPQKNIAIFATDRDATENPGPQADRCGYDYTISKMYMMNMNVVMSNPYNKYFVKFIEDYGATFKLAKMDYKIYKECYNRLFKINYNSTGNQEFVNKLSNSIFMYVDFFTYDFSISYMYRPDEWIDIVPHGVLKIEFHIKNGKNSENSEKDIIFNLIPFNAEKCPREKATLIRGTVLKQTSNIIEVLNCLKSINLTSFKNIELATEKSQLLTGKSAYVKKCLYADFFKTAKNVYDADDKKNYSVYDLVENFGKYDADYNMLFTGFHLFVILLFIKLTNISVLFAYHTKVINLVTNYCELLKLKENDKEYKLWTNLSSDIKVNASAIELKTETVLFNHLDKTLFSQPLHVFLLDYAKKLMLPQESTEYVFLSDYVKKLMLPQESTEYVLPTTSIIIDDSKKFDISKETTLISLMEEIREYLIIA